MVITVIILSLAKNDYILMELQYITTGKKSYNIGPVANVTAVSFDFSH